MDRTTNQNTRTGCSEHHGQQTYLVATTNSRPSACAVANGSVVSSTAPGIVLGQRIKVSELIVQQEATARHDDSCSTVHATPPPSKHKTCYKPNRRPTSDWVFFDNKKHTSTKGVKRHDKPSERRNEQLCQQTIRPRTAPSLHPPHSRRHTDTATYRFSSIVVVHDTTLRLLSITV